MSLFITFEGIEGSGKSTQAKRLYKWLSLKKYDCVFTQEPGGSEISESIRKILLNKDNKNLSKFTELFLYLADRAQNVEEIIRPALLSNKIVIADRFIDSTIAYQGGGRGISEDLIKMLNDLVTYKIIPDLTILLDIPPKIGLKRLKKKDRLESEGEEFFSKVREAYLELAKKNSRIKVIDGSLLPDEIEVEIRELVKPLLSRYNKGGEK